MLKLKLTVFQEVCEGRTPPVLVSKSDPHTRKRGSGSKTTPACVCEAT